MWKARWVVLSEPRTFSFKQFRGAVAELKNRKYILREGKKSQNCFATIKKSLPFLVNKSGSFPLTDFLILKTFYHSSFQNLPRFVAIFNNIIFIIPFSSWQNTNVLVHPLGIISSIENVSGIVFLFTAITQVQVLMTLFLHLRDVLNLFLSICTSTSYLQFQGVPRKSIQNQNSEKGEGGIKPRKSFSKEGMINKN